MSAATPRSPRYPDVEVVDIFRRPEAAGAQVDEEIALGAKAVDATRGDRRVAVGRARDAGLDMVMDRCPDVELARREA